MSRWLWLLLLELVAALSPVVKIGAIFTEEARGGSAELAFKYAVYRINKERSLLPNSTLVYDIQYTPARDSFRTYKKACTQIKTGAVAVFSSCGPLPGAALGAVCRSMHVPHLVAAPGTHDQASSDTRFATRLDARSSFEDTWGVIRRSAPHASATCHQPRQPSGAVAVFSSCGPLPGAALGAVCRSMHVPHLVAAPRTQDQDAYFVGL
ncbi:glutamate receptor ionotropic, kainate 2-like [Ostrinia nubilalis]|uniref:glutamate receptor ionotropic, kainate 2-like n=1 Tax=Ostrinia nubilalis TaxID=29057 RepID=UPI0030822A87